MERLDRGIGALKGNYSHHCTTRTLLGESIQPKHRILIVDDHEDGAEVLGRLLELHGFATHVVTDSTQALRHIREFQPHFIVLDLAMPRLSGYELSKQIRQQSDMATGPLIALSGFADKAHAAMALNAGCDYHLPKPLDMKEFHRLIASELEKRRPGVDGFFVKT
jgi:DNA-binding response OmpR family regulator